jgi:hypothetical protein
MSTLQTTERKAPSLHTTLNATLALIGVLVAIAVGAIVLANGSTSHVSQPTPVVTNVDSSTAYGPHYYGTTKHTAAPSAVLVTANNQDSAAYTRARRSNAAR